MNKIARVVVLTVTVVFGSAIGFGQSVSGVVRDSNGDLVAGARLILEDASEKSRMRTTSKTDGSFGFTGVEKGDYGLRVIAKGFEPWYKTMTISRTTKVGIELRPRNVAEEISVTSTFLAGTPDALERTPGSIQAISRSELEGARVFNFAEALRKISGVVIRNEEGFGLRPNISIRGSDPTRSRKILLLEDGVPLAYAPYGDNPPAPLPINEELYNETVYLGLSLKRRGSIETDSSDAKESLARFNPREIDVEDNVAGHESSTALQVGELRLRLLLDNEQRSNFSCLALARVLESRPDKGVVLDKAFLPTCLDCSASAKLKGFITELQGLLEHRCEALAGRVSESGRGGVAEIADFLMLLLINRSLPLVSHLANLPGLHPEAFYRSALQIAGELATFTAEQKRPPAFPAYQHDDPENTFAPLMKELRRSLSMVLEQKAIALPLEERKYGVRVATFADKSLLHESQFVLAIKADIAQEILQSTFPSQIKIGPVEHIRQMVNSGLPGIGLSLLPVAPRQIPYHAGFTYFELDRSSRHWQGLEQSSAFAMHVSGDFPGLTLEFWSIKG